MIELQARSCQQRGNLLGGDGGVFDDEPVYIFHQHQGVGHPRELGDLFGSSICGRDDVQGFFGRFLGRRRRTCRRYRLVRHCRRGLRLRRRLDTISGGRRDIFAQLIDKLLHEQRAYFRTQAVCDLYSVHGVSNLQRETITYPILSVLAERDRKSVV